jgi:hypothetical protein
MSKRNAADQVIAKILASYKGGARDLIEEAAREAYHAETRRCAQVVHLCCEAGLPERALEMIDSRRTVGEVTELLKRAAVRAQWDRTIDNTGLAN